jgi:hypothetical protein
MIASLAAAAVMAAPAFGQPAQVTPSVIATWFAGPTGEFETEEIKVFRPVHKTPHMLLFAPTGVSPDAVRNARIRMHDPDTGRFWVRQVGTDKVRNVVELQGRLPIHRAPQANGRLKLRVAIPHRRAVTSISAGPSGTIAVNTASFSFASTVSGSSFHCQLDSAPYASCTSPKGYQSLSEGAHTFSVRATDAAGTVDPSPATRSFTVDLPDPTPPVNTIPSSWRRSASFESTLNAGVDFGWRADAPFELSRTNEAGASDGSYAAKIATNGGDAGCSCPRMTFQDGFAYGPGDDVWVSGSWRIPNPQKVVWSRFMNLGHYEGGTGGQNGTNWYLALESLTPGMFQVSFSPYGDPHVVVLPARPIPVDRWFRVDLHYVLSPTNGQALTEWFIDGELVGTTTKANTFNADPLTFYNAGLSHFCPCNGNTTVYFDAPRLTSAP